MIIFKEARENSTLDPLNVDKKERMDCFDLLINPPMPPIFRSVRHSSSVYFLSTQDCDKGDSNENCEGKGKCSLSRCTCKNGYHGLACNKINCKNSLCYVDVDNIEI